MILNSVSVMTSFDFFIKSEMMQYHPQVIKIKIFI